MLINVCELSIIEEHLLTSEFAEEELAVCIVIVMELRVSITNW
jgi:hypothetical protein